jgi:molybdenum cofactor cytidylyltransferase
MSAPPSSRPAVHAALLAAGGSRRLGHPKQLVRVDGEALVRRAARAVLGAGVASLTVVLGARAGAIALELAGLPLRVAENPRWEEGMGTSIRCALDALAGAEARDGLLLLTCDQLEVTSAHLARLLDVFRAGAPIAASGYAGVAGVPALFGLAYRDELARLPAAEGAKAVLLRHAGAVQVVPLPGGERDLDTARDLEAAGISVAAEARTGV